LYSRSLESIPAAQRSSLPKNTDCIARTGKIKGGINILKAIKGDIALRGIEIDRPEVNLVAVNDTLANYLILPPSKEKMKMPEISLDTIRIGKPMKLSYLNLAQDLDISAVVDDFRLFGKESNSSAFSALISAAVSARAGEFSTAAPLPVKIQGDVALTDNNEKISIRDLKLAIADIKASATADLKLGDNPTVYPLSFSLDAPDAFQLLSFVPAQYLPEETREFKGYIPLNLKADLLSPYPLKGNGGIPAITASLLSDGGNLSFRATPSQTVVLSGLGIDMNALINPASPDESKVRISDVRMESDGTSLHISGELLRLLSGNPDVHLDLQCAADLEKATNAILPNSTLKVTGDLTGNTTLSCQLSDLSKKQLKDLKLDGDFQIAALSLNDAASRLSAHLNDFSLKIAADVPKIAPSSLSAGK
ncbi:MAG: hypothetical protein K2H15_01595, partial [Muribaculaceae bacterium]|nr:hypothetical protein [Muribaculaceae bacterium]